LSLLCIFCGKKAKCIAYFAVRVLLEVVFLCCQLIPGRVKLFRLQIPDEIPVVLYSCFMIYSSIIYGKIMKQTTDIQQVQKSHRIIASAFSAAFPHTLPIFAGFWFLGMTYGIYMHASGFSFWYPMLMSLTIFAGSMEFVAGNLLLGAFNPLQAFVMTLMINARHLFYGIAMLDRFRGTGWKKIYLIFGMCDETFSINYTADIGPGVDKSWFMFFVTLLNHFYWFSGATLGGLFGGFIRFNTKGLDFVLTAMFVVIFMEQWLKEKNHVSSLAGIGLSVLCLLVFGPGNFIIPSMAGIFCMLTALRRPLEKADTGVRL